MAGRLGLRAKAGAVLAGAFYRAMRVVMLAAIAVHFRRVLVVGRKRFPVKGPVLLVANHPSTWSDVLLLDGLLGRRLHFLADVSQFRPWPRKTLVKLFGTLPVHLPESGPFAAARNEKTFRRCHALFDRGEAVAIFPEGISRTDHTLMPLKRGAARLALSYARMLTARPSFTLVPVALRYSDRTAFRSDTTVTIGEPIELWELRLAYRMGDAGQIERLTARITGAIRALAVMPDDLRDGAILDVLAPIAAARAGRWGVAAAEGLERSIAALRWDDPESYARLGRIAHDHARALRALRVTDAALRRRHPAPAWRSCARAAADLFLAAPAIAGAAIHAIPAYLTHLASRHRSYGPSEIAFARITAGFFLLVATYAALAWLAVGLLGVGAGWAALLLASSAALGWIAIAWGERMRPAWERWRLARIARRHPGLVARARRSEAALDSWVTGALRTPRVAA